MSKISRIGKLGIILSISFFVLKVVLEQEITTLWNEFIKNWLVASINIKFDVMTPVWVILLILLLIFLAIYKLLSLKIESRIQSIEDAIMSAEVPEISKLPGRLTPLHITNAVRNARKGIISNKILAELVIQAVNSKSITADAARDALNESPYELVDTGEHYAYIKRTRKGER